MIEKLSECCNARLYKYDKNWDDGLCIKCDEHSPAIKEHLSQIKYETE